MIDLIILILFGLSIPLGSAFIGRWAIGLFKIDPQVIPYPCRIGAGLIILTFLLILQGFLRLYYSPFLIALWLLWLMASVGGLWELRGISFFTEKFTDSSSSWNSLFLRICIGVMLIIYVFNAMTPETRHDPYDYHLTIPTIYLANHSIVEIPWHVFSYMPKNCEIVYGLALAIGEDHLVKLLHLMFGCLCILTIASFIKKIISHEAALLTALLVITIPLFGFVATASYIDLGRAFWELGALYLLSIVWDKPKSGARAQFFILSGLFAGMALGTKYVSFMVFFIPYLMLVLITLWKLRRDSVIRLTILWSLAVLIPVAPWMICNMIWTQNPVYPLLPQVFGMNIPPAQEAYQFIRNHAPPAEFYRLSNIPHEILKRINNLLLEGNALVLIGMVALLVAPWWSRQPQAKKMSSASLRGLSVYVFISSMLFVMGCDNMDGRFFFSTIALLSIPAAFMLEALANYTKQTSPWGKYIIPGFALVLLANSVTYRFNQLSALKESPIPIITEDQRDQWLGKRFSYYRAAKWANKTLPEDSLVLGMGYPLKHKHIARIKYGYIPFLHELDRDITPGQLAKVLWRNHVTHLVDPYLDDPGIVDLSILKNDYLTKIYADHSVKIYQLKKPDNGG